METAAFDLSTLNPEQREAVLHEKGPLMIIAGAGSGKTRVITSRVAHLIQTGLYPSRILAVTFTNKAAKEMRARVEAMIGDAARNMWIGTFHSTCARLLRQEGEAVGLSRDFVVYDDGDQNTLIRDILKSKGLEEKSIQPRALLSEISRAKEKLLTPEQYAATASGYFEKIVAQVFPVYNRTLAKANALDFDDILLMAVRLLQEGKEVREKMQERFEQVMVDEYQDVNFAQYKFADILSAKHKNITIVGDDDQSIYGWRGADLSLMLRFTSDHPDAKIITLDQNYRSTKQILDGAYSVVRHNRGRNDKKLWTQNTGGSLIQIGEAGTEQDEAMLVADTVLREVRAGRKKWGDFAVLYRMNAMSRVVEEAFVTMRIPHILVGGQRFYERKEIKDMIAYLRVVLNSADDVSVKRSLNTPSRGIGQTSVQKAEKWAADKGATLFETLANTAFQQELQKKQLSGINSYIGLIEDAAHLAKEGRITPVLTHLMKSSGLLEELRAERTEESQSRLENLQELVNVTTNFDNDPETEKTLGAFLESVALSADTDSLNESGDSVTLMTLHSSKGLEFPAVFLMGLEEGVFPHSRALDSNTEMEEERRLCYVGMTRAKEDLYLTFARRRSTYGQAKFNPQSRFLGDIPRDLTDPMVGSSPSVSPVSSTRTVHLERSGTYSLSEPDQPRQRPSWTPPFQVGQKVQHKKFGLGIVIACAPLRNDAEVTVGFPGDVGVKKLVQSLAKLESVS
ncbi:MAG: UvrD-helicase domain-containing protein [Fimbriimonadaceae bacterium]|jgi:DNA helicase-2/ATP-dependent DNA helicase PcrA|nr:UvrD-helicase domain-containing protein [Fimbriimonadaceae bacterium]